MRGCASTCAQMPEQRVQFFKYVHFAIPDCAEPKIVEKEKGVLREG